MRKPPLCTMRELQDGTYDLADVADMIDSMMVEADNGCIQAEAEERKRGH